MKIESRKYYRTRDGRKVGPMLFDRARQPDAPWHGNVDFQDGRTYYRAFTREGRVYADSHVLDLVSEWVDEPTLPHIEWPTRPQGLGLQYATRAEDSIRKTIEQVGNAKSRIEVRWTDTGSSYLLTAQIDGKLAAYSVDYDKSDEPFAWAVDPERARALAEEARRVYQESDPAMHPFRAFMEGASTVRSILTTDEPHETLRDRFAMAALQGLLASPTPGMVMTSGSIPEAYATYSYDFADAMLEARKIK